jgi:hypothetical protein
MKTGFIKQSGHGWRVFELLVEGFDVNKFRYM